MVYHGDGSVYVTSSAICTVLSQPQTGHRTEKRHDVKKKNETIAEVIMCGKIKGGLNLFNFYDVNIKFVCFGSQRGNSSHVQMQCHLNKRVVVRY